MKTNIFAAALAILTLATASAASAQDYRRDRDGDWDRRGRTEIIVRDHGRVFSIDRRDRIFYRLLESPFRFRPGFTYAYTDDCRRGQCRVLVFAPYNRRPIDSLRAPPLSRRWFDGRRESRDRWDNRWDDRDQRGQDDWDDDGRWDDRDGRDGRRYEGGLEGGPRPY